MHLLCLLHRHAAAPGAVYNQGRTFGRCRRCRRDIIAAGGRWRPVPRGFRVAWRPRPGAARRAPAAASPAVSAATLPAPARRRAPVGWRAGLGDLVLAALRVLAWQAGDRLRDWRGGATPLRLPRPARLPAPPPALALAPRNPTRARRPKR